MHIGVLALQGDYAEHINMLQSNNADVSEIRLPSQLDDVDGLIIPGGESTTIVQLIDCLLYTSPSPRDATLSRMPACA